jgi:hypothetical protein
MATKKWVRLPGGRWKRWKKSRGDDRPERYLDNVPPRWYRNMWNRRERQCAAMAILQGTVEPCPYVHPREAAWYW